MSLKILLADDSMTAQNMGKKILVDGGYEVVAVSNGAAAVKKLAEFTPDLVIADVYMPGYNGLEICERVKKSHANVPVLLSVGKLEPFRPEEGVKVHADGIIIKPFEATDLLAVTAKLAERVGKVAPPTVSAQSEEAESAVEVEEQSNGPVAPVTVEESSIPEATADVPAFGIEEFSPAPAAAFAVEEHQPDYVREFGLDPHDAPTTMFRLPVSAKRTLPEPSVKNDFADFEHFQAPVSEPEPMAVPPASLNVAINNAFSADPELEPDAAVESAAAPEFVTEQSIAADDPEPVAQVAPDDFEAKLAAAMAEYEAPADERTPAVEPAGVSDTAAAAEVAAPVEEFTAVAPVWVAEEAPLTSADHAVNLEQEFRAFAAVASGGAAVRPAIAPVGPLGDTSAEDEVASIVEESKECFFPSTLVDRVNTVDDVHVEANGASADLPVTEAEKSQDKFVALEIAGALADPTAIELPQTGGDWGVSALEHDSMSAESPTFADETAFVDGAGDAEPFTTAEPDEITASDFAVSDHAGVPELITHDVPTEWNSGVVLDEVAPGQPASETADADHALFTHDDFPSPEAPFAHAAVEEAGAAQPMSAMTEMVTPTVHEVMAEEPREESVASAVSEFSNNLARETANAAPTLDQAAISDAVERVMNRMKTDLVTQIAKELAAKLGK